MQIHGNKVFFVSLGCARNLVDTEVMLGILLKNGYEPTPNLSDADVIVINTCGFLEASRKEGFETIEQVLSEKKSGAKLVVAGCMVSKEGGSIREKYPEVHYLLGSGDVEKILEAVKAPAPGESIGSARSYLEWGEVPRTLSTPGHYAYLKIAEGCAKRCAFCIIPTIKGALRSKTNAQVMKEFKALLNQGVHEIILIAQDLGDFGKDRKEKGALAALIREMLEVEKPFWLRFLYLYPDEITPDIVELMQGDQRICKYLDMPIQHINNTILKAMHRTTSKEQIIETLQGLRAAMPDLVIRTSLMVGFPGETEEQFQELLSFIQEYPLDNVGIFKYSREEQAFSARLPHEVSEEVKQERLERLAAVQNKMVEKRNRAYIGKRLETVVEGYHPDSNLLMRGRFYGQCPDIDGQIIINDGRKVKQFGQLYEVEITDVAGYDLIGRVVSSRSPQRNRLTLV